MSTALRCPRCGSYWAGVDGLAAGEIVCFDCLSKPSPLRRRLSCKMITAIVLVGLAGCATALGFFWPRSTSPAPAAADRLVDLAEAGNIEAAPPENSDEKTDRDQPMAQEKSLQVAEEPIRETPIDYRAGPERAPMAVDHHAKPDKAKEGDEPKAVPQPPGRSVLSRERPAEAKLLQELATAPEEGLGSTGPTVVSSYITTIQEDLNRFGHTRLADPSPLIRIRPDLRGLSLRVGPSCQLSEKDGVILDELARKLRVLLKSTVTVDGSPRKAPAVESLRGVLFAAQRDGKPGWVRLEAVRTLTQMLTPEEPALRKMLVQLLDAIPDAPATNALADRAVYDLDVEVRQAAVAAPAQRELELYRPALLKALRFPWAPVADHAAEVLVALGDQDAVPHLVSLLRKPDPTAPEMLPSGHKIVREVVRVNHLANCLMCHPPSYDGGPAVGVDPTLNIPLTVPQTVLVAMTVATQQSSTAVQNPSTQTSPGTTNSVHTGCHDYRNLALQATLAAAAAAPNPPVAAQQARNTARMLNPPTRIVPAKVLVQTAIPLLIRGDITFFRQDFSVKLSAPGIPGVPADGIRFDFMVRIRTLTPPEVFILNKMREGQTTYPQREAVLFALRELTGKDAGPTTEAWQAAFPSGRRRCRAAANALAA